MGDFAFLVDTTKCIGCKACQVACKQWNNLPAEEAVLSFNQEYTYPKTLTAVTFNHVIFSEIENADSRIQWQMMHKKCFHCEIPNCLTVCPAGAIYKDDYWVVIDQAKCIGCKECVNACIYNVPHVSESDYHEFGTGMFIAKNKAYKCHACRVKVRDIPACVSACPSDAITFGYRVKIAADAKKRLRTVKKDFPMASVYGLEEYGGLHVITILKDRSEKFGLVKNLVPIKPKSANTRNDLYGILSSFSLGLPSLNRIAFKISKYLTS